VAIATSAPSLDRREELADIRADHRRPLGVVLSGEVVQPDAAQMPALLQAREDLQQRVVPAAAAPEGGDHERQAQTLALGHARHGIEQRRGALAPEAGHVLVVVVVALGRYVRGRWDRRDSRRGVRSELR
jgi:hypothetical protein